MRRTGLCALGALLALVVSLTPASATRTHHLRLYNGVEIVVVEDHRAPVVTHIVGYRAGGAADPPGRSGLAHFVEHLLFKKTGSRSAGTYARLVSRFGGSSNAVTTHDATIYHARVPKEQLGLVMELEADRMQGALFDEQDVASEREVILAERRGRIDGAPLNVLTERLDARLYGSGPYARPSIGLEGDIRRIGLEDAQAFYRRHYGPRAAFVVVVGDVSPGEVIAEAVRTYGALPGPVPVSMVGEEQRAGAPPPRGGLATPVVVEDPRVPNPLIYRIYDVPSRRTGGPRVAAALEVMTAILAAGSTSRLAAALVERDGAALSTDGGYLSLRRHGGQLALYAAAAPGVTPDRIEAAIDAELARFAFSGPSDAELRRAKSAIAARLAYEGDDQLALARRYADALGAGVGPADVNAWQGHIAAVGAEDVRQAAKVFLVPARAVTGYLLPPTPEKIVQSGGDLLP